MVTEGDLTLGGEHTMQFTDDVSQNCTFETYIILLTDVTPINLIKFLKNWCAFFSYVYIFLPQLVYHTYMQVYVDSISTTVYPSFIHLIT